MHLPDLFLRKFFFGLFNILRKINVLYISTFVPLGLIMQTIGAFYQHPNQGVTLTFGILEKKTLGRSKDPKQ